MIEKNIIIEKYASMPDSELISFAREEGHQLTAEGLQLLNAELNRRRLEHGITENIERGQSFEWEGDVEKEKGQNFSMTSLQVYALEQKEHAKSNEEIMANLIETGLDESFANHIVSNIETNATQRLKKSEHEKLIGSLFFICGVAITFLPLSPTSNRLTYIFGWCAIIVGALKYIKGMYYKSRFKKVLINISREKL